MSDEEVTVETSDGQILAAEYKDGQLQIVEVTPFDKDREPTLLSEGTSDQSKYMQVLDTSKGLVSLDLLNLTLVRCPDGEDGYQFVANATTTDDINSVTCVLQSSDGEDPDNQDSYVMVDSENGQGSLVFLKSSLQDTSAGQVKEIEEEQKEQNLTPTDIILKRAKALQKAKALLASTRGRGRKRKSDLPPPHELLASPNFKLYLYSCKMCSFKCNAVKEMSAHKTTLSDVSVALQQPSSRVIASEHGSGSRGRPGNGRSATVTLQCARCPYRAAMHSQLMKHVQEKHLDRQSNTIQLDSSEVEAADVLVCGACGFESGNRSVFKKHIEEEHGATTC